MTSAWLPFPPSGRDVDLTEDYRHDLVHPFTWHTFERGAAFE